MSDVVRLTSSKLAFSTTNRRNHRSHGAAATGSTIAPKGDDIDMTPNWKIAAQIACIMTTIGISVAYAQSPSALEQAELAGLTPEMRTEVQKRAVSGNSVTEVLQVML